MAIQCTSFTGCSWWNVPCKVARGVCLAASGGRSCSLLGRSGPFVLPPQLLQQAACWVTRAACVAAFAVARAACIAAAAVALAACAIAF